jgi:NAD+ diphosphatase
MSQTSTRRKSPLQRLQYAGAQLDRAALLREDEARLAEAMADSESRVIPVWRGRNLVVRDAAGAPAAGRVSTEILRHADEVVFLGRIGDRALFAADVSSMHEHRVAALASGEFVDLRRVGALLASADAEIMAYARGMLHWHRHHRFCGRCGAASETCRGGHRRVCSNADCAHSAFPRTDPAMIVLVIHPERSKCLLGRARGFPERVYSTLAGFVEPGESLEATVRREVHEEAGVIVGDVRYMGSQPWPFPSSLMVGFHATAETTDIRRHDGELVDARWFSPEALREAGEWGGDERLCLPRRDSIARALIEAWLATLR